MSTVAAVEAQSTVTPDLEPRAYARAVRRVVVLLVVAGVIIRLVRSLIPVPIYGDEAMLGLNLLSRDYATLTRHLDHGQVAPVLFLWAERFVITTLGTTDWLVHLVPLLASLGGLLCVWDFAKRTTSPTAAAVAVGLLATSVWPVSMAATLKPYSSDLFWSALLLALAARWHRRPERPWPLAALVLAVPFALAGSYPTVFVAGAITLYLLPVAWSSNRVGKGLFVGYNLAMIGTFLATYALVGQAQVDPAAGSTGQYMRWYWRNGFPPDSIARLPLWILETNTGRMFAYPAGDSNGASALTTLLFLVGATWCWRNGSRPLLVVCLVPFGLNLLAAILGKYPYAGCCRLSQHLAPAICVLTGVGTSALLDRFSPRRLDRLVLVRWIAAILIMFGVACLLHKAITVNRDPISRFSSDLHHELTAELRAGDRIVGVHQDGMDATARWHLERFGDRVSWVRPGDPLPDAERLWVITVWPHAAAKEIHEGVVHSAKGWQEAQTFWYAVRPDSADASKLWWHAGVTCLARPASPRPIVRLNAVP